MTNSRATALLICMHFTTKSEAFHTGQAGLAQTNTITITRLPTEVRNSYNVDDPIQLNIPSSTMQPPEKDSYAPHRPLAGKVNYRHSSRDWIHNVASIPSSSVLREIMNPVLSITGWSTFVSIIYRIMTNTKSTFWNQFALSMCIPTQIHSFLVSSLGLLLVFRTNSAYQRFVEGRRIWEQILSTSRNFSRMMSLYESQIGAEKIFRIKKTLTSFPYLLRHHIRPKCLDCDTTTVPQDFILAIQQPPLDVIETRYEGGRNDERIMGGDDTTIECKPQYCNVDKRTLPWCLFSDRTLAKCAKAMNRPLWTCDRMAREIVSIPYTDTFTSRERLTLIGQVDKLSNAIGECERIHQTAVPLNYARHALRSLALWLATLPFALVKDVGLLTGPVVGITAWLFFGIYQIGHSIEDPFQKTLRLSILCDAIHQDVLGEAEARNSAFTLDDLTLELYRTDVDNSSPSSTLKKSHFQ